MSAANSFVRLMEFLQGHYKLTAPTSASTVCPRMHSLKKKRKRIMMSFSVVFSSNEMFCFTFYQGMAIFLDSLEATGTDESAQNDSI